MHTLELTQRPPISRRTPSLSLFTVSDFADKEEERGERERKMESKMRKSERVKELEREIEREIERYI